MRLGFLRVVHSVGVKFYSLGIGSRLAGLDARGDRVPGGIRLPGFKIEARHGDECTLNLLGTALVKSGFGCIFVLIPSPNAHPLSACEDYPSFWKRLLLHQNAILGGTEGDTFFQCGDFIFRPPI